MHQHIVDCAHLECAAACCLRVSALSFVAGFLEAHSAALVQLMLHTLPFYHDLDSQRAVTATVKQAVLNGTFLKTLAGALVKLDVAAVSRQVSGCACHL